jgi:hypothetical protein
MLLPCFLNHPRADTLGLLFWKACACVRGRCIACISGGLSSYMYMCMYDLHSPYYNSRLNLESRRSLSQEVRMDESQVRSRGIEWKRSAAHGNSEYGATAVTLLEVPRVLLKVRATVRRRAPHRVAGRTREIYCYEARSGRSAWNRWPQLRATAWTVPAWALAAPPFESAHAGGEGGSTTRDPQPAPPCCAEARCHRTGFHITAEWRDTCRRLYLCWLR